MYSVVSSYVRKDGLQRRTYVCRHRKNATGLCDQPPFDATVVIDAAVIEHLNGYFLDLGNWVASLHEGYANERARVVDSKQRLEAEATALDRQKREVTSDYLAAKAAGEKTAMEVAVAATDEIVSRQATLAEQMASIESWLTETPAAPPTDSWLDIHNALRAAVHGDWKMQ